MTDPRSTPRSRGPKTVKVDPEHILDAAQRVFAQTGINGSSIRAISKEAGCDPALIYYHFQNKEAMFAALLDRKFPVLQQEVFRLTDPTDQRHTVERLWDMIQVYRRLLVDDAGFRALIRGEILIGTEGIREAIAQRVLPVFHAISNLLQQGIERGHVRADLPTQVGTFSLVRPYIELLDVIPAVSLRLLKIPPAEALRITELAWFELYWRGISSDATLPPFLLKLKESSR